MSFKTFKNGDTLYAKDLNDFAAAITENQAAITKKANLADVYTTTQADELLAAKATVGASYTKDEANDLLAKKADAEAVYTKAEIDAKISATFRYKGKIDSVDGLPTEGNEAGDVYKVADDSYVWNGTSWDQLDQDVDLSAYLTIEAADAKFAVADEVAAQYATQADMTEALAQKQPLGDYADESEVNAALAQKLDQTAASETYATKVELEGKQPAGDYALRSELPAVDEFITKTGAEEQFAPKQLVIQIPIRTLEDKVYTKEQIFGWFKCKDEIDLKTKMTQRTIPVLYMCVTYSSLPHVYTMAVQYLAFESQTQVKLVCVGLDTKDDTIAKYTIVMNLDGTVFEGTQSNVKLEMKDLEI